MPTIKFTDLSSAIDMSDSVKRELLGKSLIADEFPGMEIIGQQTVGTSELASAASRLNEMGVYVITRSQFLSMARTEGLSATQGWIGSSSNQYYLIRSECCDVST